MFFSVFGQTPKHVFLSVLGSASPRPDPVYFSMFLVLVKNLCFLLFFWDSVLFLPSRVGVAFFYSSSLICLWWGVFLPYDILWRLFCTWPHWCFRYIYTHMSRWNWLKIPMRIRKDTPGSYFLKIEKSLNCRYPGTGIYITLKLLRYVLTYYVHCTYKQYWSCTKNRTQREKGDTPFKRGSSLRNYLDQTQSSEFE